MNAGSLEVKGEAEVIFFDAAGTLIQLQRPVGWHYAEIARRHGLNADEERMDSAFRRVWGMQNCEGPLRAPARTMIEPGGRTRLDVLRAATSSAPGIDQEAWFEELYWHFAKPGVWFLYDDAKRCLEQLAGRFRLAIISNFDRRLWRILTDLGVAANFEQIFLSSEIGCEKPHPRIFQRALEGMNVAARRCVHAGDDPAKDWAGASAAGIAPFRLRRPLVNLDQLTICLA